MLKKCVSIGTIYKGGIKCFGIFKRLLHTGADWVLVVLGFNNCERQGTAVIQNKISALFLSAKNSFAAHDNPAGGKTILFANLLLQIPAGIRKRRENEFGANILLGKFFFRKVGHRFTLNVLL